MFQSKTVPIGTQHFLKAVLLIAAASASPAKPQEPFYPGHPAQRRPGTTVRIDLIGDSTQTDSAGYGRGFCANLAESVDCLNMAKGGASTKTFREDGLWDRSLATRPDSMSLCPNWMSM